MPVTFECLSPILAPAFTPASLPNLVAWYSADSGVYSDLGTTAANNGDPVEQWNDKSVNNYHLTQTGVSTLRPTFGTASFNSLNGLTFVASALQRLVSATNAVSLGSTTQLSLFLVGFWTSSSNSFGRFISYQGTGATADYDNTPSATFLQPSATTIAGYRNSTQLGGATITNGTNYRIGSIFDGSVDTLYINNVAQASPAASTGTFASVGTLSVASDIATSARTDGVWAEIVVTSAAIGSTDRTSLDNYFKAHWGL